MLHNLKIFESDFIIQSISVIVPSFSHTTLNLHHRSANFSPMSLAPEILLLGISGFFDPTIICAHNPSSSASSFTSPKWCLSEISVGLYRARFLRMLLDALFDLCLQSHALSSDIRPWRRFPDRDSQHFRQLEQPLRKKVKVSSSKMRVVIGLRSGLIDMSLS